MLESLYLTSFDGTAADPDKTFEADCSGHGANGSGAQLRGFVLGTWEEFLDGLLENLQEGNNHDLKYIQISMWTLSATEINSRLRIRGCPKAPGADDRSNDGVSFTTIVKV